ncbi:TrwC relaxase [Rhodothermus marinus SG0.5JP17-172]|uniref:relaxase domain-containing protein n=1 Tax=Rhodothermus marinus TaxID=29549 RepID=UPI000223D803|nr:relaxase domain-containing protein [Rhodothermus marinus]AEN73896.1 TrwC relaxase [Rhodothermus marinus SG0.5JP17-172]
MVEIREFSLKQLQQRWPYYFESNIYNIPQIFQRNFTLFINLKDHKLWFQKHLLRDSEDAQNILQKMDRSKYEFREDVIEIVLSSPKHISIALMAVDDHTADHVIDIHEKAVIQVLKHILGRYFTFTNSITDLDDYFVATCFMFTHYLSRDLDPHLHTHILIMSSIKQKFNKINNKRLIHFEYLKTLASGLDHIFHIHETFGSTKTLKVEGISPEAERYFSKRRSAIMKNCERFGHISYRARNVSWIKTRNKKTVINFLEKRDDLRKALKRLGCFPLQRNGLKTKSYVSEKEAFQIIKNSLVKDYGYIVSEKELRSGCVIVTNNYSHLRNKIFEEIKNKEFIKIYNDTTYYILRQPDNIADIIKTQNLSFSLSNSTYEIEYLIWANSKDSIIIQDYRDLIMIEKWCSKYDLINNTLIIREFSRFNKEMINKLMKILSKIKFKEVVFIDYEYNYIKTYSQRYAYCLYSYIKQNKNACFMYHIFKNHSNNVSYSIVRQYKELLNDAILGYNFSFITDNIKQTLSLIKELSNESKKFYITTRIPNYNICRYYKLHINPGDQLVYMGPFKACLKVPTVLKVIQIESKDRVKVITDNNVLTINTKNCILTPIEIIPRYIATKLDLSDRKIFVLTKEKSLKKIISWILFSGIMHQNKVTLVFTKQHLRHILKTANITQKHIDNLILKLLQKQSIHFFASYQPQIKKNNFTNNSPCHPIQNHCQLYRAQERISLEL